MAGFYLKRFKRTLPSRNGAESDTRIKEEDGQRKMIIESIGRVMVL